MSIIEVKNLNFSYDSGEVLKNINFKVNRDDFITLIGNNGSGKSTLIKILIGELKNYQGSVKLFDKEVREINDWKKVGYVPQIDRDNSTNFPISVKEMILLNLYYDFNKFNLPKKKHFKMVDDIISTFNLQDFKHKNFNELSGGQKQRVMIARAMIHNPELLIFDEPTVGIDKESKKDFYELIKHLNQHHNITIILVTHETDFTNGIKTKRFIIKDRVLKEDVSI
ncbi:MAG: metal ABC transporter ATP-binding protein [Helcococcus sp.]|nr:metal ABC transporter ATP-binding protein [Helcococcus sp.]